MCGKKRGVTVCVCVCDGLWEGGDCMRGCMGEEGEVCGELID